MIARRSPSSSISGTHISVNLFRRAGDNSFFPKSPPGFIVANIRKVSAPTTTSAPFPPFSASVIVRPGSSTLLRRSSTASSASDISSSKMKLPSRIAWTRGPSCHSKRLLYFCCCCFTASKLAWALRNTAPFVSMLLAFITDIDSSQSSINAVKLNSSSRYGCFFAPERESISCACLSIDNHAESLFRTGLSPPIKSAVSVC